MSLKEGEEAANCQECLLPLPPLDCTKWHFSKYF